MPIIEVDEPVREPVGHALEPGAVRKPRTQAAFEQPLVRSRQTLLNAGKLRVAVGLQQFVS
jgi:hypothetical protein